MSPDAIDRAVLLTGRGGSGTRLLSEVAAAAGVFIGNHVNRSGDSIEWADLIYRMVVEAARNGALPAGSRYRRELRATAERILGLMAPREPGPWGFKLPEMMLVLPMLLDAFPLAKVIHLTRHPVSSCLRRTHITSRLDNPIGAVALPAAYRYANRDPARITADEPYLNNAYAWNFQVTRVARHARDALSGARYLEIKYEDVCAEPDGVVAAVRTYLGQGALRTAASIEVDPARAAGWDPRDPRAEAIWDICGNTAALLGYARDSDAATPPVQGHPPSPS